MDTAQKIKKIRLALCLSQKEFAQALNITVSSISHYEKGSREPSFPTIRKIMALAQKHGIKIKLEDIRDNQ